MRHDSFEVLRNRDFVFHLVSRFVLTLGIQIQNVAIGWQIYELTGNELALGLIGLAEAIPNIAVSLFAGHLADSGNRRTIILIGHAVITVSTLILVTITLLSGGGLDNTVAVWGIYGAVIFFGFARGYISPAAIAFRAQLIPQRLYGSGSAWASMVWQIGYISGPAIGGITIGVLGLNAAYVAALVFLAISFGAYLFIAPRPLPDKHEHDSIWQSLAEGVRFVTGNQIFISAISLDLFAVLFGGATALLPVFAKDILHVGPEGFGLLRAAPAIGAALTALVLAIRPIDKGAGKILLCAVSGFGLMTIVFGVSSSFALSVFALAAAGAFDSVSVVLRSTIMQTLTPPRMMGRVSAVNSVFIGSSNEIGAFESGVAARLLGVVPSVVFGGIMTNVVVAITAWRAPKLRQVNVSDLTRSE